MDKLELIDPTADQESEYRSMIAECIAEDTEGHSGFVLSEVGDDFAAFVGKLENDGKGIGLPEGWVPQNTYWLVRDGTHILGEVRLRHRLVPHLLEEGGHVGYMIRPSERRKGYGTLILSLVLEKARKMGIDRVLVTCDDDNIGSSRIIEKNGGVPDESSISPRTGKRTLRYWIRL